MPSIQIFKPGPVTSMEGVVVSFTDADLQGIAQRYDPTLHEAPFVVGHPQHDAPAYAWTAGLSFADGVLTADAQQVDPEFAELHRKGRFKKISARFYTPTCPNNPTPGEYYLRDVGWLGAMAPAVKGLRTASFADEAGQLVTGEISFGDLPAYTGGVISRMFRGIREYFIAKEGQEFADRLMPDWQIDSLREIAQRADESPNSLASFRDVDFLDIATHPRSTTTARKEQPSMSKTPEQLQADLNSARAEIQRLQEADRKRGTDARHAEHISFADALITGARWPADLKDVLVATLDHLATPADKGCVSFGDGEAAKPLHEVLRTKLEALPPLVSFGEVARKGAGADTQLSDRQISNRAAEHRDRLAAKGQHISIGQAIDAVKAGTDKD